MNRSNCKKADPSVLDFQWAGTVARVRRAGGTRAGRRSALLGLITAAYANSSRGTRPADARPAPAPASTPTDRP